MTEIIVLGAGIGGVSMAYELRALVGRKANRIRSGFTSCPPISQRINASFRAA